MNLSVIDLADNYMCTYVRKLKKIIISSELSYQGRTLNAKSSCQQHSYKKQEMFIIVFFYCKRTNINSRKTNRPTKSTE